MAPVSEPPGRLQPTRAGVINVWDYRDEEFVFADGRLVLRGPNGSGKTKALEVLFPFVLDGRIDPRRLNPFSGENRTMKSNLLYRGQDVAHAYVWLEFGRPRRGDTGDLVVEDAVTVGVGMRAQRHNDRVARWYFVADGRVGLDFVLLDQDDRPVTKRRLIEQVGAEHVTERPIEHRAAVDERLFGLGPDRFEQMLTLVLTLRRPQLARDLDPPRLSQTLTEGLRPVDDDLLAEAARSFEDMERVQRTLDGLVAADTAAATFLAVYTTYVRTHARQAADELTRRRERVRAAGTTLAAELARGEDALQAKRAAERAAHDAATETDRERARLRSLERSAAYQHKGELEKQAELVDRLADAARVQRDQAADAARRRDAAEADRIEAESRLADAHAATARAVETLAQAAAAAGIDWGVTDSAADGLTDRVTARVVARRDDVAAVEQALIAVRDASRERTRAEAAAAAARSAADAAESAEREAGSAVREATDALGAALAAWDRAHGDLLAALAVTDLPNRLRAAVPLLGEPDAPDLPAVYQDAVAAAVTEHRDAVHRLGRDGEALAAEIRALREERAAIAAERDDAPPPFAARTADRSGRAGAPLWRLVRFGDGVSGEDAAAVEAALEAANLLDAWVPAADGVPLGDGDSDGYLLPLAPADRPAGASLADVLVPEDQQLVAAERVAAVLASVAVGDVDGLHGVPTVSRSGRFTQGIQLGAHAKPVPEYVGATARAQRRARRLADCDRRIAESQDRLDELSARVEALRGRLDDAASARAALPRTGPLVAVRRRQADAAVRVAVRREALDAAGASLDEAIATADVRERALRRTAAERSLAPPSRDEARRVGEATGRFERDGAALVAGRRTEDDRAAGLRQSRARLASAAAVAGEAALEARRARDEHARQAEELATLERSVGADVREVMAAMERARRQIATGETRLESARAAQIHAEREEAAAVTAVEGSTEVLRVALREERDDAHRLTPFAPADVLELLHVPPELGAAARHRDWPDIDEVVAAVRRAPGTASAVTGLGAPVVALHDAVRAATRDLSPTEASLRAGDTRLTGALRDLQDQLAAAGQDYRPEWESRDGVIAVHIADEQGLVPIAGFARRIAAERSDQELLLTESERRVLEDALLARLAQQIHDRIVDARDLITSMSDEMRARRMSSGTTVAVTWALADGLDPEQRAVSGLLDRGASRLSAEELARMRAHFATRIKTARAERRDSSYHELLADVLDYRRWRSFVLWLVRPDRKDEQLTRARHSQLSGGEQSVSLHLPLFAAAHAMLTSARADAPRLVALDEAFAGVDDTGRRELLGLTAQFDLDLFMTGFDLWAAVETLPACAHYDLSHSAAEHMLSAILIVFDGTKLITETGVDLAAALGSPGTRRRGSDPHPRTGADGGPQNSGPQNSGPDETLQEAADD